jgi:demethylmenaquinone methyltransferase/2-methoxy-6-polyprenyl-1,4-benzoquinol methylase
MNEIILEEMKAYYRARANEYDEWFFRQGRYDQGAELNALWFRELQDVQETLRAFRIEGDVLELAPGTGIWTERFVQSATSITAVDASPEMIAINKARVANARVSYVQADLFTWQPDCLYDAVCFCFWLSHIPAERLSSFVQMVAKALRPRGKIFFVDSRREPSGTAIDQMLPGEQEQVAIRTLNDSRQFHIIKNFYDPAFLEKQFAASGLSITVKETPTYFLYGYGTRNNPSS